ncbi:hypothetical protein P3G22_20000, partial [Rhodopseudomonas sp. BAL398]|nr:hypothetical protein [Rhodopseudomonas sp. BAL398]
MIQMAINTLSSAAIIAPAAVAFTLVFTLFRYANFAVGGFVTIGAFAAWTINVPLGLPLWIAGVGAMIVCAVALAMSDRLVFRPLRGRGGGTLLLVSIALSFVLENIVRFIYGAQMKGFDIPLTGPLVIWGARITRETFAVVSVSLLAIVAVGALLVLTPIGRGGGGGGPPPPPAPGGGGARAPAGGVGGGGGGGRGGGGRGRGG